MDRTGENVTGRLVVPAAESWQELRVKETRDFSLDLSRAKPASHFMKIVEDHSIEVPV